MDDKPRFRNPDKFQVLPLREWIRQNCPTGKEGFVYEDLDLVVRFTDASTFTLPNGQFMLIEKKHHDTNIEKDWSKLFTFGTIDTLLRRGDPHGKHYKGYYVLQMDNPDPNSCLFFRLNGIELTKEQFQQFLMGALEIPPYDFSKKIKVK